MHSSPFRAAQPRLDIMLAGEINLDLILYGLPAELPMERELLASDLRLTLGSSSAILAHNLAALGATVGFATRVGDDPLGQIALELLRESGTEVQVTLSPGKTTGLTVLLAHRGERRILTYPGVMAELTCEHLDREFLATAGHFHLSSLFLQTGLHAELPALLRELKERGLTLSLDTNDDPADVWGGVLPEILPLVDILLPNEGELLRMAQTTSLEEAITTMSAQVPTLVIKRGARGATVVHQGERVDAPSVAVMPVDTIGAGDSFNAGFLFAFLRGAVLPLCAAAGNVTGALSTLRPGGTEAFRDADLRRAFLKAHWPLATTPPMEAPHAEW